MTQTEWFKWNETQNTNLEKQADLTREQQISIITTEKDEFQQALKARYEKLVWKNDKYDLYNENILGDWFEDSALRSQVVDLLTWANLSKEKLLKFALLAFPNKKELNKLLSGMKPVETKEIDSVMQNNTAEVKKETPKEKLNKTISNLKLDGHTIELIVKFINEYQWDITKVLELSNKELETLLGNNKITWNDSGLKKPLYYLLANGKLPEEKMKDKDIMGDIQKSNDRAEKLIVEKQLAEEARLFAKNQAKQKNKNRGYASLWDVIWGANPYSKN